MGTIYRLDGFEFRTEEAYQEAKKEAEAVAYIRQKTDLGNAAVVLKLYNKLVERGTFTTPVGIAFLKELRDGVLRVGLVDESGIKPLPKPVGEKRNEEEKPLTKEQRQLKLYQKRCRNKNLLILALTGIIVALFCIRLFGTNSPYRDYETEVLDQYAGWADDLAQKEQELYEWENALKEKDAALSEREGNLLEREEALGQDTDF